MHEREHPFSTALRNNQSFPYMLIKEGGVSHVRKYKRKFQVTHSKTHFHNMSDIIPARTKGVAPQESALGFAPLDSKKITMETWPP